MHPSSPVDSTIIRQLLFENSSEESARKSLSARGFGEELIGLYLKEYKRLKHARQQRTGFCFLAAGAALGFIGCVLALTNPVPAWHDWFLFGFTLLAILIAFIGLYFIFE